MSVQEENLTKEQEIILDMFTQGCWWNFGDKFQFNHQYLSAYEDAQSYLLKHKIIEEEDCYYI